MLIAADVTSQVAIPNGLVATVVVKKASDSVTVTQSFVWNYDWSDGKPRRIVVPVSALVALKEGGYAVEEVTGKNPDGTNATKLVGVKPGLFTNGFVQVDGDLKADTNVVVPS